MLKLKRWVITQCVRVGTYVGVHGCCELERDMGGGKEGVATNCDRCPKRADGGTDREEWVGGREGRER